MTPAEHDEQLLSLERRLRMAEKSAHVSERSYRVSLGQRFKSGKWVPDELPLDGGDRCVKYLSAVDEVHSIRQQIAEHERTYTGWQRFRLVVSSDGHVHGDSRCRSFRERTQTVIIPALSGKQPEDAVTMLGNSCCSVCLPRNERPADRVPSSLVNVLLRHGTAAFESALARRNSLAAKRRG